MATEPDVSELTKKLVRDGFAVQQNNTKEVTVFLEEQDSAAELTGAFQQAGFIPLFINVLPEEASFGASVRLVPVTTLDEVPDDN